VKVLIVSTGLPSKRYPLEGVFAFDQAKALAAQGLDMSFFSIDLRSIRKIRRPGFDSFVRDNVKCYTYSVPLGPVGYRLLTRVGCKVADILYKKVYNRNQRPDIIHTHFAAPFGAYLSKKYSIPLVITEHSSEMNRQDLPQEVIDRSKVCYQQAEKVITVSSLLADSLLSKTGIRCKVIHNIIDTTLFSAPKRKEHDGFTFVVTALLSERKRVHQLIPVMTELPETVKLIIVGDGTERSRLELLIAENALEQRAEMKGLLSREETAQVYSECDCFVLPSALETFGVVYVEAMAAGLPVIATRCGGPEDFVTDENGLLIDVDNQVQLSDAMHYMVENAGKYSSNEIKEYVQSRFSPEVIAKEIISVYKEIVKE
jgi:glycosyltransferase involved in cell wall biosynthesis